MNNDLPKRKPTRLKEYDYSTPGAYFITICTKDKDHLFGKVLNGQMHLTNLGEIVNDEILKISSYYPNVRIDKYVIMPNHIHMIIVISQAEGINPRPEGINLRPEGINLRPDGINPFPTTIKKYDIPNIIGKFKAGVTRTVGNAFMHSAKKPLWQRSFHDHIIRGEEDYKKIWEYIDTNVFRWENDCFYIK